MWSFLLPDWASPASPLSGRRGCYPSHDWRSPVIMKTQPEYVALTCAMCGALKTVHGGGRRIPAHAPGGGHRA